jgi:hypothetical protein
MKKFDELKDLINSEDLEKDVDKFDNGTMAAVGRIRKAMQLVKSLGQEIRLEVQAVKNENKKKK